MAESSWSSFGRVLLRSGSSKENLRDSKPHAAIYSSRRSIPASGRVDLVEETPSTKEMLRSPSQHQQQSSQDTSPTTSQQPLIPSKCWDEPREQELMRSSSYLEDRVKERTGAPLLALCATQLVDLQGATHCAGATAALLASGGFVPPPRARFVFTVYFMNPTPPRSASSPSATPRPHALLLHFASETCPSEATGSGSTLLNELWRGDPMRVLSRLKVLSRLHSGPSLLKAAMAMARMDASRPMLVNRFVHSSLHRSTLPHPAGGGATVQHVEIALDCANNYWVAGVYRAAFSAVTSIDVSLTFVLEGRTKEELPERALACVTLRNLDPAQAYAPHASWPTLCEGGGATGGGGMEGGGMVGGGMGGETEPRVPPGETHCATPRQVVAEIRRSSVGNALGSPEPPRRGVPILS